MTTTTPNGRARRYCTVAGCGRPHHARGLCLAHYQRQRRHSNTFAAIEVGDQVATKRAVQRQCREPGCDRPHVARGLCQTHYQQARRLALAAHG